MASCPLPLALSTAPIRGRRSGPASGYASPVEPLPLPLSVLSPSPPPEALKTTAAGRAGPSPRPGGGLSHLRRGGGGGKMTTPLN